MELVDGVLVSRGRAGIGEVRRLMGDIAMLEAMRDPPPDSIADRVYYEAAIADGEVYGRALAAYRDAGGGTPVAEDLVGLEGVQRRLITQATRIEERAAAPDSTHIARLTSLLHAGLDRRAAFYDAPDVRALLATEVHARGDVRAEETVAWGALARACEEPLHLLLKARHAQLWREDAAAPD